MISEIDFGRQAGEFGALVEVRQEQARRAALGAALMEQIGTRVRVAARVHLLPGTVERELLAERATLEDSVAVLRHCDPRADPRCTSMLEHARRMHERVRDQLAEFVCEVDVTVGGDLGDELLAEVARIIDSGLVRLAPDHDTVAAAAPADLTLVDFDLDSVERVGAFVAHIQQIGQRARQRARMHVIERLRAEHPAPQLVLAEVEARRLRALRELDMARALRAAVEEVQRATGGDPDAGWEPDVPRLNDRRLDPRDLSDLPAAPPGRRSRRLRRDRG